MKKDSTEAVDVSVLIVNYHTLNFTKDAVKSFMEKSSGFSYEILIIDNSCDDQEYQALLTAFQDFPAIHVYQTASNIGFGQANNLGASKAKGQYLYLLNEDTMLINNACYYLLQFLSTHPRASMATSNLYSKDLKPTSSFDSRERNIKQEKKNASLRSMLYKKTTKKIRHAFNYSNEPCQIYGFAIAASTLVRKEDFEAVGGFDKDIFLYSEDCLLCYEILHVLKKEIWSVPSSRVIHLEGMADKGKQTSLFKARAAMHGQYIYFLKAFGKEEAIVSLKIQRKAHQKYRLLYRLAGKKENVVSQSNYLQAIDEELAKYGN